MDKEQIKKRLKSLVWRGLMMCIAVIVDGISGMLIDFHLPPSITIIIGLILGEISKYLNNKQS